MDCSQLILLQTLKKGEDCGLQSCLIRAKYNGSMTGAKHRRLPSGTKCATCGYEQKVWFDIESYCFLSCGVEV